MGRRLFLFCSSSALPRPPSVTEPLTPPFGFLSRPAGRRRPARATAGPGHASAGGRVGPEDAGRPGPRRARLATALGGAGRPGPRPDPARARGFRRQAGTAAGPPDSGTPGFACAILTFLVATPSCLSSSAFACVLFRRRRAALWEPCGAAWLVLRRALGPSFYSEQCAGQDGTQAVGFIRVAGRSCRV